MPLVRNRSVLHHPFAPWLAPPDQLVRTLVSREEALRNIVEKIETMGKGGGAKHVLIIGPRGMGKTHLVCVIHHYVSQRIQARPDLPPPPKNWTSVLFVEEEYPAHNTLANWLLSLCAKLHEADPVEEAWRLPETLQDQSDRVVIDCCLERIQEFSTRQGKKLLILVDNIQKILQKFPAEDHHRLRAFLMDQAAILLVGTAPWLFEEVIDYKAPFFEFFETIHLSDLTEEEMLRLLEARFREDGLEADFRRREENLRRKIPAIRKLTGGNPRLILFLYDIVTRSAFLEVESALRELIEELSDYFRARYDALADQPRKVLDTLAQMEGPTTPTEIARAARLSVQKVNAQLRRLKKWGCVEPVKHEQRRATHYDVTERLFRIWRQTATVAGRQRFRFLVQFLKIYYTPEGMIEIVHSYRNDLLTREMSLPNEYYRHAAEDLYYFQEATSGPLGREIFELRMEALIHSGDYGRAEQEVEHFLAGSVQAQDQAGIATACQKQAEVHAAAGKYEEALKDVKQLLKMGHYQEALAAAETVLLEAPATAEAWAVKGDAAGNLGNYAKALESFQKAIALQPEDANLLIHKAWTLSSLGKTEEALAALDEALNRMASQRDIFHARGDILLLSGRFEEAREALEKGLAVTPDDWDLLIDREIVRACLGKHGSNMEGLAAAILAVRISSNAPRSILQFLFDIAAKCITRNDLDRARCLLDVAFSMPWQKEEWFGKTLGILLGKLLDGPPHAFEMAIDKVKEKIVEPNILALLNPYLQAAAYSRTGDLSILDRLFPEVRELVLEISQRLRRRTLSPGDG